MNTFPIQKEEKLLKTSFPRWYDTNQIKQKICNTTLAVAAVEAVEPSPGELLL